MTQPGLTIDACANCHWPEQEHRSNTGACPDYGFKHSPTGWLSTRYREKRLVLTESVMTHILADIDQIVTEHEIEPTMFSDKDWWTKLRHTIDGEDYKQ